MPRNLRGLQHHQVSQDCACSLEGTMGLCVLENSLRPLPLPSQDIAHTFSSHPWFQSADGKVGARRATSRSLVCPDVAWAYMLAGSTRRDLQSSQRVFCAQKQDFQWDAKTWPSCAAMLSHV